MYNDTIGLFNNFFDLHRLLQIEFYDQIFLNSLTNCQGYINYFIEKGSDLENTRRRK